MPARRLSPKCRHVFALIAVLVVVPVTVNAQSGSVTLQATVSETVALSILANSSQTDPHIDVVSSSGNIVRITFSADAESTVIRVPLLVRSNSGFKISAVFESQTALLTQLSVIDVKPLGRLVSREAVNASVVAPEGILNVSRPLLVLSGPRVSLGGTLDSPNNALQVTLLIRMKPETGRRSTAQLTFIGTAGRLTP
jgi:hypothetical protein